MSRIVSSAYNNYLKKYSSTMLRRYQGGKYSNIGRATGFKTLVYRFMCDHLITEEQHSWKHHTPIWMKNAINRFTWFALVWVMYTMVFCLGKQHQIFNTISNSYKSGPYNKGMVISKYENMYAGYRAPRGTDY